MFLRYTALGVGHPVSLQKTVRDCSHHQPAAPAGAMYVDDGGNDDGEDHKEDDDEQQTMDIDLAEDEESESEDEYDNTV
jgi:hypothetical protein